MTTYGVRNVKGSLLREYSLINSVITENYKLTRNRSYITQGGLCIFAHYFSYNSWKTWADVPHKLWRLSYQRKGVKLWVGGWDAFGVPWGPAGGRSADRIQLLLGPEGVISGGGVKTIYFHFWAAGNTNHVLVNCLGRGREKLEFYICTGSHELVCSAGHIIFKLSRLPYRRKRSYRLIINSRGSIKSCWELGRFLRVYGCFLKYV